MRVVASIVAALFLALAVAEPAVAASRYVVMPGDTLSNIARRFHVPLPLLEQINAIRDPARLRAGQVLMIPDAAEARRAPAAGAAKPARPTTARAPLAVSPAPPATRDHARQQVLSAPAVPAVRYVVRAGDTLYRLALTHGTTVQTIEAMNGLVSPAIRAGQVIRLPQPWAPPAKPAAVRPAPAAAVHPQARVVLAGPASPQPAATKPVAAAPVKPVVLVPAAPAPSKPVVTALAVPASPTAPVPAADPAPRRSPAPDSPLQEAPALSRSSREDAVPAPLPSVLDPATPAGPRQHDEAASRAAAAVRTATRSRVRETALGYLGVPYRWGGATVAGVDCSGLVYAVYSPYVANLPRTSYEQWTAGVGVDRADLEVGDLVFFNTDGSGASHVGIYVGDGQFVHPATAARRVVVDRLDAPYYLMHYLGARRVL